MRRSCPSPASRDHPCRRGTAAFEAQACRSGQDSSVTCNKWTDGENEFLRVSRLSNMPVIEIAALLPRHPYNSVRAQFTRLGLTVNSTKNSTTRPVSDHPSKADWRPCLGALCNGSMFWSVGIGNRMCGKCLAHAGRISSAMETSGAGIA